MNARVAAADGAEREGRGVLEGGGRVGEEVRGGGADQCLDGSQYHNNSER